MGALGYITATLASDVANAGTVAVSYPSGLNKAAIAGTTGGKVAVNNNDIWPQGSGAGTVSFAPGASTITITNNSGVTWAAGSTIIVSFGTTPYNGSYNLVLGGGSNQAAPGNAAGTDLQTLTASGAVLASTEILEVAHASVVVAATMDAAEHRGFFTVRNTSASGTVAHTVTLTNGTWNGTATVATLDAAGEALTVRFDGNGRGQVIENTGSVGLS
jgi:hypothetical protein